MFRVSATPPGVSSRSVDCAWSTSQEATAAMSAPGRAAPSAAVICSSRNNAAAQQRHKKARACEQSNPAKPVGASRGAKMDLYLQAGECSSCRSLDYLVSNPIDQSLPVAAGGGFAFWASPPREVGLSAPHRVEQPADRLGQYQGVQLRLKPATARFFSRKNST